MSLFLFKQLNLNYWLWRREKKTSDAHHGLMKRKNRSHKTNPTVLRFESVTLISAISCGHLPVCNGLLLKHLFTHKRIQISIFTWHQQKTPNFARNARCRAMIWTFQMARQWLCVCLPTFHILHIMQRQVISLHMKESLEKFISFVRTTEHFIIISMEKNFLALSFSLYSTPLPLCT